MDDQGLLKQQKMKWQIRGANCTNDEKLKHVYDKADHQLYTKIMRSRSVHSISAEGPKREGQTILLQNPGLWQKPTANSVPSFGLRFYQRAGAASKEQEVN